MTAPRPARVFYVQQPGRRSEDGELQPTLDLTPAERWGTLVPLLSPTANPWGDLAALARDVEAKLRSARFGAEDHLLLVGHVALQSLVSVAASRVFPAWGLLVWNRRRREYESLWFDAFAGENLWAVKGGG